MNQVMYSNEILRRTATRWDEVATLIGETSTTLSGAGVAGLAPSVQDAARTFLTAWSGYAGESADIATGYADSLREYVEDFGTTDAASGTAFKDLDSRLGPQR